MAEDGVLMHPFLELLFTTFITAVASAAMGLMVSSLFTNADRLGNSVGIYPGLFDYIPCGAGWNRKGECIIRD